MQLQGVDARERREKHRLPFNRLVRLKSPSQGEIDLIGLDYSPSGISIQSQWPLTIGEKVGLRFQVGRNQQTELEVCGEIVHNNRVADGFITGIRFLSKFDTSA